MSVGGYDSVEFEPSNWGPLLMSAAECGELRVAEIILSPKHRKVPSISATLWAVVFARAFQRHRIRLMELLLDVRCDDSLPRLVRFGSLILSPGCGVDRVAPTLLLKDLGEPAAWLDDILFPEPCVVELVRPTFIYWACFMPDAIMPRTPDGIVLSGQRMRASLRFVVGRGADVNAVATLSCISLCDSTRRLEYITVLGLFRRKQRFIKARCQENLKPLEEYLEGIINMLGKLGAREASAIISGSWVVTDRLPGAGRS
jgi:hypothetical protein